MLRHDSEFEERKKQDTQFTYNGGRVRVAIIALETQPFIACFFAHYLINGVDRVA